MQPSQVILQVPTWFAMTFGLVFLVVSAAGVIGIWLVAVRLGSLQKSVDHVVGEQRDQGVRVRLVEDRVTAVERSVGERPVRVVKPFENG